MTDSIAAPTDLMPQTLPRRYLPIGVIGSGGMGIVYRVVDRLAGEIVALKQIKAGFRAYDSEAEGLDRISIAHEFKTLSMLRHPYILPALDFGFATDGSSYFTMPLLQNPLTILEFAASQPFSTKINLLMQVLQAMVYLHQHSTIHNDLKPNNILVENGHVHILDFGIASIVGEKHDFISGTPRYIAPELLRGDEPSWESDLYAVGIIAYEVFSNETASAGTSWHHRPTPDDARRLPIADQVRDIVACLLSDYPAERVMDLPALIKSYTEQLGQALPYAELATQESFLNAAPFLGRSSDFARLRGALDQLLSGTGGLWLVGGESGIGKSRLLEELRVEALVKNISVVGSQTRSDLNRPFQFLEPAIRWLTLSVEVDKAEASILKLDIPDLDIQAEYDQPALEPQAMQRRFLDTVEAIFRRSRVPLLVIVEDAHWLTPESIDVFSKLTQRLTDTSTLFVASYRPEDNPGLMENLPHAQRLMLQRLSSLYISNLITAMLGQDVSEEFLGFIEQETQGNPFFVVEVTRALAEAAGGLRNISTDATPGRVYAIGRDNVLQRRIQGLPTFAQQLLPLAAVIGRSLDEPLFRELCPNVDLDQWFAVCADRYVLEAEGNGWRFAHDQIRENILSQLSSERRMALHRQVAQTLERRSADDDMAIPLLAHHWASSGDVDKEAHYSWRSGELFTRQGSYQTAATYLQRATELEAAFSLSQRALNENLLGEALFACGYMVEGEKHLYRALLGHQIARPSVGQVGWQILRQLWYRAVRRRSTTRSFLAYERKRLGMIVRACEKLAQINYVRNQKLEAIYYALQGLNLSDYMGIEAQAEQVRFYGSMALSFGLVSQHILAHYYLRQADIVAVSVKNQDALAWTYEVTATYLAGCGQWNEAEARYLKCIRLSNQIGNKRRLLEATAFLAVLYEHKGQWDDLDTLYADFEAADPHFEDKQARFWYIATRVNHYMLTGNADLALDMIAEIDTLVTTLDDRATQMRGLGLMTLYYLYYDLPDVAQEYAEKLLDMIQHTTPVVFATLYPYVACAAFYLCRWMVESSQVYRAKALQACQGLNQFARVFSIGRPYALAYTGWYYGLLGKAAKAKARAEKALYESRRLCMPDAETIAQAILLCFSQPDGYSVHAIERTRQRSMATIRTAILLPHLAPRHLSP